MSERGTRRWPGMVAHAGGFTSQQGRIHGNDRLVHRVLQKGGHNSVKRALLWNDRTLAQDKKQTSKKTNAHTQLALSLAMMSLRAVGELEYGLYPAVQQLASFHPNRKQTSRVQGWGKKNGGRRRGEETK